MKPLAFALLIVALHLAVAGISASRHLLPEPISIAQLAAAAWR
jgi:hypothetical protein